MFTNGSIVLDQYMVNYMKHQDESSILAVEVRGSNPFEDQTTTSTPLIHTSTPTPKPLDLPTITTPNPFEEAPAKATTPFDEDDEMNSDNVQTTNVSKEIPTPQVQPPAATNHQVRPPINNQPAYNSTTGTEERAKDTGMTTTSNDSKSRHTHKAINLVTNAIEDLTQSDVDDL